MYLRLKQAIICSLVMLVSSGLFAATITGSVTTADGATLGFSSITVKNKGKGVVANGQGVYALTLAAGDYVLICHHVAFKTVEKSIRVGAEHLKIDFVLPAQELIIVDG